MPIGPQLPYDDNLTLVTEEEISNYNTINSTGVISGGVLSIGSPNTTFSISDGTGVVVDNTSGTPSVTTVSWSGKTNIAATYVATNLVSYVAINSSGTVIQSATPFTNSQHRDYINLGSLIHVNLTNLDAVNNFQEVAINPNNQLTDLTDALGIFNISGNIFSANGANLKLNKSSGTVHSTGSNWATDTKNPNTTTLASLSALTFQYRFQTGTNGATGTDVNPDIYDVGGVSTAVPANKFTIQRIYSFVSNNVKIQPGQAVYNSLAEAKAAIQTEVFTTETSISNNGLLRGFLVVRKGTTNLTSTTDAYFYEAGKFGSSTGVGGQSVSTMQNTYNNSISPEILTDTTRGAVTIQRGSSADSDSILEGLNGAGSTTFSVTGAGNISGNNLSGTNTGDQNLFSTVAVSGQSNVVADSTSDTLTLVAGTNITITTDASTDSITINSSGGGGGNSFETIAVAGQSDVVADSSTDTLTLVAGPNITITTNAGTDSITIAGTGGATLGDADYGDITVSSSGTVMTIDNGVVTLAKMADMATDSFLGRDTAGTGSPEVLSVATTKTLLGLTGTNSGDQTSIVGITGTKAEFDTACTDGNFLYVGDVTSYTDEMAQDAVGAMVSSEFTYTDGTPELAINSIASTKITGLGTIATQASNSVSITGGSVTGITDLAIADGGTGASTAIGALTNLGITYYVLTGDTSVSSTTSVNITGWSFTATASKTYLIETFGWVTAGATTTGHRLLVDIPDGTVYGVHDTGTGEFGATVADNTAQTQITGITATAAVPSTGRYLYIAGGAGGTVQMKFASEVSATTTIKTGSVMRVTLVN